MFERGVSSSGQRCSAGPADEEPAAKRRKLPDAVGTCTEKGAGPDEKDDASESGETSAAEEDLDVIDVPPELNSTKVYCATLGHKANHKGGGQNNAVYST